MFPWVVCLAWTSVLSLQVRWCEATPLPVYIATESSGDHDMDMSLAAPSTTPTDIHMAPLHTTHRVLTRSPILPSDSAGVEHVLLEQVRDFLQENLVMVLLVSSLLAAGIFLVCCASSIRRQRKFAAYYPSSFPATCYVDQRDRAGGEPAFRQVANKHPDEPAAEPRDAAHQLRQDILSATRKLRQTPTKTPTRGLRSENDEQSSCEVRDRQQDNPKTEETPTQMGQEEPLTQKGQGLTPAEIKREATPAEAEQEVAPAETEQEVAPAEREQEVAPTEAKPEVLPTDIEKEVTPTEIEQEVTPTEIEQEVTSEIELGLTPTESSQEVLERDLLQSAVAGNWAQQEIGSSPVETLEVVTSSVKLICGETTAF